MQYEPIWALFQGFEPLFGSYDPDLDPDQSDRQVPELKQSDKQDPDPVLLKNGTACQTMSKWSKESFKRGLNSEQGKSIEQLRQKYNEMNEERISMRDVKQKWKMRLARELLMI